jgi:hypothetical protein
LEPALDAGAAAGLEQASEVPYVAAVVASVAADARVGAGLGEAAEFVDEQEQGCIQQGGPGDVAGLEPLTQWDKHSIRSPRCPEQYWAA